MMNSKQALCLIAGLLSLGLLFQSCKKPEAQPPADSTETEQTEQTRPPKPQEPEDLTDYQKLLSLPFEGLTEASPETLRFREENGGITVTGYLGSETKVKIPSHIHSKPVIAIGGSAFRDCDKLTVLEIPDSVEQFGKNILVGCSNLFALKTPLPKEEGTAFLGYLFGAEIYEKNNMPDLRNLDFLVIGGTPETLPAFSLYDCNDLIAVGLPDSVKTLGDYSLYRCESLKYVTAGHLETVGVHAMDHCESVTKLEFGSSLKEFKEGALENCKSLAHLTVPFVGGSREKNTYLSYVFGAVDSAFPANFYPSSLKTVTVTDGLTDIPDKAFYGCKSLTEVILPQGITSIGVRAFSDCVSLKTVRFPDSLTEIKDNAFVGCGSLETVRFGTGLTAIGVNAFAGCRKLVEISLPVSLASLPNSCFAHCSSLSSVDLENVEQVGINAFYGCTALKAITANRPVRFEKGNEAAEKFFPEN